MYVFIGYWFLKQETEMSDLKVAVRSKLVKASYIQCKLKI